MVSDIIVSSDSDRMLKMAQTHGVKAWKRPERYEKSFMMEVTKKQAVDIDDMYDYVMAQAYYGMKIL